MEEVTISLKVDKEMHKRMKLHNEINWNTLLRKSIIKTIEDFGFIDKERAGKANAFSSGKEGVQIIREWRNKRR